MNVIASEMEESCCLHVTSVSRQTASKSRAVKFSLVKLSLFAQKPFEAPNRPKQPQTPKFPENPALPETEFILSAIQNPTEFH